MSKPLFINYNLFKTEQYVDKTNTSIGKMIIHSFSFVLLSVFIYLTFSISEISAKIIWNNAICETLVHFASFGFICCPHVASATSGCKSSQHLKKNDVIVKSNGVLMLQWEYHALSLNS